MLGSTSVPMSFSAQFFLPSKLNDSDNTSLKSVFLKLAMLVSISSALTVPLWIFPLDQYCLILIFFYSSNKQKVTVIDII